jgi:hypothetical protein
MAVLELWHHGSMGSKNTQRREAKKPKKNKPKGGKRPHESQTQAAPVRILSEGPKT